MRDGKGQQRRWWGRTAYLLLALAFVPVWVACYAASGTPIALVGAPNTPQSAGPLVAVATSAATAIITATATGISTSTSTPNSKEQFATKLAINEQALRTSVALTGVPTWTPGAPPPYTGPTMTPVLGIFGGESGNDDPYQPRVTSVWRGWVSGQIASVYAGDEGPADEPSQGLIQVLVGRITQFYRTPEKVGALVIKGENNGQLTLVSEDGLSTYFFDLPTRQWISMPGLPLTATARPTSTEVSLQGMYIPRDGLEISPITIYSRWSRPWSEDESIIPMWVEAGSEGRTGDEEQGLISVTVWQEGYAFYRTPARAGAVRISGKVGDVIDFITEDGKQTFAFDLVSRTWVTPASR